MTDLVKQLRGGIFLIQKTEFDGGDDYWTDREATNAIMDDAADRIEELEVKLAEAAEALRRIASNEFAGVVLTSLPPQDGASHFARMTLAKIDRGQG